MVEGWIGLADEGGGLFEPTAESKERNDAVHGRSFRCCVKDRVWVHPESWTSPA